ncbi:hypothetical protein VTO73DRAFT_15443 [Trametes versicolor]
MPTRPTVVPPHRPSILLAPQDPANSRKTEDFPTKAIVTGVPKSPSPAMSAVHILPSDDPPHLRQGRPICADLQGSLTLPPPPRRSGGLRQRCLRLWHTVCRPSSGFSNPLVGWALHVGSGGPLPLERTVFPACSNVRDASAHLQQSHVTPPRITALLQRIAAAYRVHPEGSRYLDPGLPPAFVHAHSIPGFAPLICNPGRWLPPATHEVFTSTDRPRFDEQVQSPNSAGGVHDGAGAVQAHHWAHVLRLPSEWTGLCSCAPAGPDVGRGFGGTDLQPPGSSKVSPSHYSSSTSSDPRSMSSFSSLVPQPDDNITMIFLMMMYTISMFRC